MKFLALISRSSLSILAVLCIYGTLGASSYGEQYHQEASHFSATQHFSSNECYSSPPLHAAAAAASGPVRSFEERMQELDQILDDLCKYLTGLSKDAKKAKDGRHIASSKPLPFLTDKKQGCHELVAVDTMRETTIPEGVDEKHEDFRDTVYILGWKISWVDLFEQLRLRCWCVISSAKSDVFKNSTVKVGGHANALFAQPKAKGLKGALTVGQRDFHDKLREEVRQSHNPAEACMKLILTHLENTMDGREMWAGEAFEAHDGTGVFSAFGHDMKNQEERAKFWPAYIEVRNKLIIFFKRLKDAAEYGQITDAAGNQITISQHVLDAMVPSQHVVRECQVRSVQGSVRPPIRPGHQYHYVRTAAYVAAFGDPQDLSHRAHHSR